MLVDANVLLYSIDSTSTFHVRARDWMVDALNGPRRVAIPWMSIWAFVRIATNPRAVREPLTPDRAWACVERWQAAPATWIPQPGRGHSTILKDLITRLDLRGGLVSDAVLAALCIEHGLDIVSADSDFARFPEIDWINPLA
jgi:toxin-antitoxin system PIN domain toxin